MAHPLQPQALVGNEFSDAYFAALAGASAGASAARCAHCGKEGLTKRVSDGVLSWCDHGHREMWARAARIHAARRWLQERGVTPERAVILAREARRKRR